MSFLKIVTVLSLAVISYSAGADDVSKKACAQFLPALGDNNIDLIINGFKRDYADSEKGGKRFFGILKTVNDDVSQKTQERCDKGIFPIMDLTGCYEKCKTEVTKVITGTFAWNYEDRTANINFCYSACTGAYVSQNAITKTLRKVEADGTQCGGGVSVFDSRKSKVVEGLLQNTGASDPKSVQPK
jgi:hypothetical protein